MEDAMTTNSDRTLSDIWEPIETEDCPNVPANRHDRLGDMLRCHLIPTGDTGFIVATFATEHTDRRGQTGIAVAIWEATGVEREDDGYVWTEECLAYWTGTGARSLVYGSPLNADDSDTTLIAAIHLCCHAAQHDENDNHVEPEWDADGLYNAASMAECYLEGNE